MLCKLKHLGSDLELGPAVAFRRLRITPLRLRKPSTLEYLTCTDQDSPKVVSLEEGGSVPELRVHNFSGYKVFIPEGATLLGAKQNRVVNMSVMVAPHSVTIIPVSCVERQRWQYTTPTFSLGAFSDCHLRGQMSAGVTASLKQCGKVVVDQGAVWNHVDSMLCKAGAASPTRAYEALFEKQRDDMQGYERHLPTPGEASGVAVEIDETLQAVDLFDKPDTLGKLWPRLLKSYALAALHPRPAAGRQRDVKEFVGRALATPAESFQPAGIGTSLRLTSDDAVGSALLCEDQLVHLSLFAVAPLKTPQIGPPDLTAQPPIQWRPHEAEEKPHRPWWRLCR